MATTPQPETESVTNVDPALLAQWLDDGEAVLVDVREDFEHAEERIPGAVHQPLGRLDPAALRSRHGDKRIVFHCRSGKRSAQAARRFRRANEAVFQLAGGIDAWKAAGRPTLRPPGGSGLPVMRQVQLVAGFLVTLGVLLGVTVSPWWLGLAAFVGCGLMFAGASGWCGMAILLGRMPWNRGLSGAGCSV